MDTAETRLPTPALSPPRALPGVSTVFDRPNTISAALEQQAQALLNGMDPGTTTAILNVHTERGVNLAVASRVGEHLQVVSWIGKSGWDRPAREGWEGGVSVRARWGK